MKNLLKIFILIAATSSLFISCEDEWEDKNIYNNGSLVHFDHSGRDRTFADVTAIEPSRSLPISFSLGLTQVADVPVNGTLVFLPEESTAVLGTDFVIDNATATISAGDVVGTFQVTIFSNNTGFVYDNNQEITNVRSAVFEFTNDSSVPNAQFNQRFVINITTTESDK